MIFHRVRVLLVIAVLVSSLLGISSTARAQTANEAFDAVWSATDLAVQNQTATYSWFWGPTARAQRFEPYLNSPGQQREVRYYDKSRMEINDPGGDPNNIYYVTNGLLTVELVTGQLKRGDGPNDVEQHAPATQLVAGDPLNNPGTPSYAAFGPYVTIDAKTNRSTDMTGQAATTFMSGTGQVSTTDSRGVTLAHYQSITGHNIASVFWDWFNSPTSGFRPEIGIDWVYTAGLPISEPYWIDSTIGGSSKRVLVQLFERRVMTYNDSNNDPYRIEWGNIGLHYQNWSESDNPPPIGDITYIFDDGVSNEDQEQIRDGISLAANYLEANLGGRVQRSVVVRAITQGQCDQNAIGTAFPDICLNVAHQYWPDPNDGASLPYSVRRMKIAAHEYFHHWQGELGCISGNDYPVWITEGGAEFFSYLPLIEQGLITTHMVREFEAYGVIIEQPPLPPLQAYEHSYTPGNSNYNLWYLGVEYLTGAPGFDAMRTYCSSIDAGTSWQDAFTTAFGQTPDAFYLDFEEYRAQQGW